MTPSLQRITTEYVDIEDRIRLSGETENATTVVLWLTQRMLQRLLPTLLQWLERQSTDTLRTEILQSFAQQAAEAGLTPQAPVRAGADSTAWLVLSVDVTQSEEAVTLTFRGVEGQDINLTLAANPLRQWLAIVHNAYLKAEWSLDVWPVWVRERSLPTMLQVAALH